MTAISWALYFTTDLFVQLEEEKSELERMLANEKNARVLQEKINDEQQRLQSHMQEESMKSTTERVSLTFSLD